MPVAARPAPPRSAQPGRWRAWLYQGLLVAVVVAAVMALAHLTLSNMRERGIRSGFGFLPIFGGICCLLVVAGIVLAFVMISRKRKR